MYEQSMLDSLRCVLDSQYNADLAHLMVSARLCMYSIVNADLAHT